MNRRIIHIPTDENDIRDDLFKKLTPPFSKTEEMVWEELSEKLKNKQQPIYKKRPALRLNIYRIVAAAAITGILLTGSVLRFYSIKLSTPNGEHLKVNLPGNSVVYMNAGSEIVYYPFWWRFSRKVNMEGEAFFVVSPGNKFEIKTENGKVSVLGTSFNIFDRDNKYRVSCSTGSVKVVYTGEKEKIILTAGQSVNNDNNHLELSTAINLNSIGAWRENNLIFTNETLEMVLREIERQYNIKIEIQQSQSLHFTGSFSRKNNIEQALFFVCQPFNLKFEKINDKKYKIVSD